MNECLHVERVSAYHDGELSVEATREVELHLRTCGACAAELDQLRMMTRWLASAELPRLPAPARRRLRRAIDDERALGRMRLVRAITGIAASLFLFAGARVMHERLNTGPSVVGGGPAAQVADWETRAVAREAGAPALGHGAASSRSFAEFVVRDLEKGNE